TVITEAGTGIIRPRRSRRAEPSWSAIRIDDSTNRDRFRVRRGSGVCGISPVIACRDDQRNPLVVDETADGLVRGIGQEPVAVVAAIRSIGTCPAPTEVGDVNRVRIGHDPVYATD